VKVGPANTGRMDDDGPPARPEAGGAAPSGPTDGGATAESGGGGGSGPVSGSGGRQGRPTRCRHRLAKMLLRKGLIYTQGNAWTSRHQPWLRGLRFEKAPEQAVFDGYPMAIEQHEERLAGVDETIEAVLQKAPYAGPVSTRPDTTPSGEASPRWRTLTSAGF